MKILKSINIDFNTISTIIFDWGGVITNIYPQASIDAFIQLGLPNISKYFNDGINNDLFLRYEKGEARNEEIFTTLGEEIGKPVTDIEIQRALCAMMLDTPPIRLEILKELGKEYRLLLLSNTNPVHTLYYNTYLMEKYDVDFRVLFHKVYYSYQLGMRKPDKEIFRYVLTDSKLDGDETLFIDDTEINIQVARSLNIQCLHLNNGLTLEKIFSPEKRK